MQGTTTQAFEELFQDHQNNFCFECGAPSNHWASVNNGIFLCLNCSGLHRGFGVNVSFVRSVNMDSWSDLQLAMMRNGGNARLQACFDHYNLPKDGPTDFKYRTKAGVYYREMLKALAEGKPLPNPPSISEGAELAAPKTANYSASNYTGFGSTPVQEESNWDKAKSLLGTAADKTVQVTKSATEKVSDPEFQQSVKTGVVSFGTTVATGAKSLATKVNDKVHDPEFRQDVKAFGGKVATGTKEAAGFVADKTKELWANRDEIAAKTGEAAKSGWNAAVGFFKKVTSSNTGNAEGGAGGQ